MRVACVLVSSFAVAVERLAQPALAQRPLVVYDRHAVIDASPEAAGIVPGLSLRQGKALAPQATFVEANHALYREAFDAMLDALERVAPQVEPSGLGCVYTLIS